MNNLIAYKHSIVTAFLCLFSVALMAQDSYKQSFDVTGEDVVVSVNTSHTNIVFETWNKNKVEVEAIVEGEDLTAKEKKEILDFYDFLYKEYKV